MHNSVQTQHEPIFVFIAGTPCSGGSVTLASLDGHPDVLAWPYEFLYFPFFYQVAKGRQEVPVSELNRELINTSFSAFGKRLRHGDGLYVEDRGPAKNNNFNIGDFDCGLFREHLQTTVERRSGAVGYLDFLFGCFKRSHKKYRDKAIKYHAVLTGARGFNWNKKDLIKNSKFLYSYRQAESSYTSIREKQLRKHGLNKFFSPSGKKSLLYWLETYKRISNCARTQLNNSNFLIIPLKELQADSEGFLRRICAFLDIEAYPSIYNLTICGEPYKGNARESQLNQGKIAKRTSKPRTPLCSFEKRIFSLLDLFDFAEKGKRDFPRFSFFEMIKKAFSSAFLEISNENVIKTACVSSVRIFFERVLIFWKFCITYFALKNGRLKMKLIRKGNLHVVNHPLWV